LVTLPCNAFESAATFEPNTGRGVTVSPPSKEKARKAAELALERYARVGAGGHLEVRSTVPVGVGLGSSTSDGVAALRAVSKVLPRDLSAPELGALAVEAETAADAIMFGDRALLFAHREGEVLEDFGGPLPGLEVLGFVADLSRSRVDTLGLPPASYTQQEIETFSSLVELMRRAVETDSPDLVGRVASASARINQRYLPIPDFDRLERLAEAAGVLGLQVAHSGTVAGLLFDPVDEVVGEKIACARALLAEWGSTSTWRFGAGAARRPCAGARG
jgi:uncharacterized protein involved in propanediol utilization